MRPLREQAYKSLKRVIVQMILRNEIDVRLGERSLARQLGISRTPVREALVELACEGLIEIVPRQGIYPVRQARSVISDTLLVWASLEGTAARAAAASIQTQDIVKLTGLVNRFCYDRLTYETRLRAYLRFHRMLIALGQCALLSELTQQLCLDLLVERARVLDRDQRAVHAEIVAALARGDGDEAERRVRDHIMGLRASADRLPDHARTGNAKSGPGRETA